MGYEATCTVRFGGKASTGKAQLEPGEILFRGDFRLKIPLENIKRAEAARGILEVDFGTERAVFELGKDAEKWALKIRYPRGLLDKLGVKPGASVSVLGVDDPAFWTDLEARTDKIARGRAKKSSDVVVVAMDKKSDLERLKTLRESIQPAGSIWVVWPKGRKEFREDDVRAFGPRAGLVDVKVVSFSETLSGLKMVIPVALRRRG